MNEELKELESEVPEEFTTPEEKIAYLKGYVAGTKEYTEKLKSVRLGSYSEENF